ncbi:hypothetical protein AUEXF2481DRAFT_198695 [Aureobasidium subglaciale EXF-2481]|uniref:Uncharacterized protein n=1 Tax=Aureobasidium subglaciale (strain EXF-2481) TaxID=1043005 RepID=A0A074Z0B3_AURSE|nr:uncharacterized protein AUEXF2481DRAFT_198695 [Aureobasidium subglaciale EXF-2481]KEQ99817.1 hypothetical protein AUEXF2481DRAFT_198695 [Aureobasidium subglaciale EXF-2481]
MDWLVSMSFISFLLPWLYALYLYITRPGHHVKKISLVLSSKVMVSPSEARPRTRSRRTPSICLFDISFVPWYFCCQPKLGHRPLCCHRPLL